MAVVFYVDPQKGDDSILFDGSTYGDHRLFGSIGGAHVTAIAVSNIAGTLTEGNLLQGGTSNQEVRLLKKYSSTLWIVHGAAGLLQDGEELTDLSAAGTCDFGKISENKDLQTLHYIVSATFPGEDCYFRTNYNINFSRTINISAITGNIYVGDILQEATSLKEMLVVADLGGGKLHVQGLNMHQLTATRVLNVLWRDGVTDSAPFSDFCTFDSYNTADYDDDRFGAVMAADRSVGTPYTLIDFATAGATTKNGLLYNQAVTFGAYLEYGAGVIDVCDFRDPYGAHTVHAGASLILMSYSAAISGYYEGYKYSGNKGLSYGLNRCNVWGLFTVIKNWGLSPNKPFEHPNSAISITGFVSGQTNHIFIAGGNCGITERPCYARTNKMGIAGWNGTCQGQAIYLFGPLVIDGDIGYGAPTTGNGVLLGQLTDLIMAPNAKLIIKNFVSGIGLIGGNLFGSQTKKTMSHVYIYNCQKGIQANYASGFSWCKFIAIEEEIILDLRLNDGDQFNNNTVYDCGALLADADPLITVNGAYDLGVDKFGQSFFNNIFSHCGGQIVGSWGPNTIANKMGVVDFNVWHDLLAIAPVPLLPATITARGFGDNDEEGNPLFLDEVNNLFVLHEKSPYVRPNAYGRLHRGVYGEGIGDSANRKRLLSTSANTLDDTDLNQTVTGATATDTATLRAYGSGYLVVGDIAGKFNSGDTVTRGGHSATLNANLDDCIILYWDNIANGPFIPGALTIPGGTATVDVVGDDYLVLSSVVGQFLDGVILTQGATTADINGDLVSSTWKIIDVVDVAGPGYGWVESTDGAFQITAGIIETVAVAPAIETLDSPVFTLSSFATNQGRFIEFLASFFLDNCYNGVTSEYDNPGNEMGKIEGTAADEFEQKQIQIRLSDTAFFQDGNLDPGPGSVSFYTLNISRLPRYIETLANEVGVDDTVYFQIRLTANKNI